MEATTIKVREDTKQELNRFRQYKNESYDEIIKKMIYIAKTIKKQPKLSRETIEDIERSRKRIREGKFLTEEEAKKKLGL